MAPILSRVSSGFGFGKKAATPVYAISASAASVNEGSSVIFTVTTTNVDSGTTLYWTTNTVSGTVNASDFSDSATSGSFVITSGSGTVTRTLANDLTTEGSESFQLQIRTGSTSGTIVATSSTVTISDTSIDILPVTTGLLSWYDGSSWDSSNNRWSDRSGSGNNTSNTVGTVTVATHSSGNGTNKSFNYITGNTSAGVRIASPAWPSSGNYTFFHITRYTGGTRRRIWTGTSGNWLSGHWNTGSGRFYHEGFMSSSGINYFGDDWFITLDQNDFVRTNRGQYTFSSGGNSNPGGVTINGAGGFDAGESSDWACAFAAVYNRKLSLAEYELVENYMYNKYFA